MAASKNKSMKKKSREDLLLMIRDLIEENQRLADELRRMQPEPATAQDVSEMPLEKTDLQASMDGLRRSIDACAELLRKLCNSKEAQ